MQVYLSSCLYHVNCLLSSKRVSYMYVHFVLTTAARACVHRAITVIGEDEEDWLLGEAVGKQAVAISKQL